MKLLLSKHNGNLTDEGDYDISSGIVGDKSWWAIKKILSLVLGDLMTLSFVSLLKITFYRNKY